MNKRILLTALGALLLTSTVLAQSGSKEATPVYTDKAKIEPVRKTVTVRGRIIAPEVVDVYSTFGGDVVDMNKDEGDRVKRGQTLVHVKRIDPGVHYEPERVDAPLSGTITHRYISPGARVTPQTKLFEIVHDDSMIFQADLLEVDLQEFRVGLTGTLQLSNGETMDNVRLHKILPYIDAQRQVIPAEVMLPNPQRNLLTNSTGELTLLLDEHSGLTVPRESVIERKRRKGLFVVKAGTAHWIEVSLVSDLGDRLEIHADGLKGGDEVVTFGQNSLMDGSDVNVREDLRR